MKMFVFGLVLFQSFASLAQSIPENVLERRMADVSCSSPIIETQGSKIQVSYKLSQLVQFTFFTGSEKNEYKALLKETAVITGQGKASVTMNINGKKETIKDEVRKATVQLIALDQINSSQLMRAGLSKAAMNKVKFVRSYDLNSTDIPLAELLDSKGKVVFRFVTAETEDLDQYIWACK